MQSLFYDDRLVFDFDQPVTTSLFDFSTSWSSFFSSNSSGAASATSSAPLQAESGGAGWLSLATSAAGWLSLLPGPIGTVAGLVNGVGEALQGHWGAAAIGLGGAALATVGLGFLAKIGSEAGAIGHAAEEGQILYRGVGKGTFHDIQQAAGGAISPRGGNASMYEHIIENNTKSKWTSWTADPAVARETFAGPDGTVFWVDTSKISNKVTKSPFLKFKSQKEYLIEGTVYGVKRLPN